MREASLTPPKGSDLGKDPEKVKQIFSNVAKGYDKANDVLSLGIHHLWRGKLVKWSKAHVGEDVLDCATGTGDLAIEFKKVVGVTGKVIGSDFCKEMLVTAPVKAAKLGLEIDFQVADVLQLPFDDASFDVASISFGIRNVADPKQALKELHRVLRPGGRVMVLEFGQPRNPLFSKIYQWYSRHVLPRVGGAVTGFPEAYSYLEESSFHFPCADNFLKIMRDAAPFATSEFKALSFGIAYMYKGIKS